jgi:hypothetical protein
MQDFIVTVTENGNCVLDVTVTGKRMAVQKTSALLQHYGKFGFTVLSKGRVLVLGRGDYRVAILVTEVA